MDRIKITCTKEQKESIIVALKKDGIMCLFDSNFCGNINCDDCAEKNIDWAITDEPQNAEIEEYMKEVNKKLMEDAKKRDVQEAKSIQLAKEFHCR